MTRNSEHVYSAELESLTTITVTNGTGRTCVTLNAPFEIMLSHLMNISEGSRGKCVESVAERIEWVILVSQS